MALRNLFYFFMVLTLISVDCAVWAADNGEYEDEGDETLLLEKSDTSETQDSGNSITEGEHWNRRSLRRRSNRLRRRFGIMLNLGTADPVLAMIGMGLQFHVFDFMTFAGSFGITPLIPLATFMGINLGIRLAVPGWSFSPFVQPSIGGVWMDFHEEWLNSVAGSYFSDLGINRANLGTADYSVFHFNLPMGFQWQAQSGFTFQIAVTLAKIGTMQEYKLIPFTVSIGGFWDTTPPSRHEL